MRIAFNVSILVMHAMRRHPEKRATFQRQSSAGSDEIFKPFISLESAVREQPVISNANAQAARNPPQKQRDEKSFPGKHKKRCDRAYVKCDHEKSGQFADRFSKRPVPLEKIHEYELLGWLFVCLFDSSLPAAKRKDCNTCVIVAPEGHARTNWACPKVHTSLATWLSEQAAFQSARCTEYELEQPAHEVMK
jgi:hypothetical protein